MDTNIGRLARFAATLGLLAAAFACGTSAQVASPLAPSATTSGSAIVGVVTGSALRMTVAADGTSLQTPVDATGHFQLNSVPTGNVTLHFTAMGVDAKAVVPNVAAQQIVDVGVAVNGNAATITSIVRESETDMPEADGLIAGVIGTCPALSFTVGTTKVTTNAQTVFMDGTCAGALNGTEVEVRGTTQPDGSLVALIVEIEDSGQDLEGDITAVDPVAQTFLLSGVTVSVTPQTVIRRGPDTLTFATSIVVGAHVHVDGTPTGTGAMTAQRVQIQGPFVGLNGKGDTVTGPITLVTGVCPALQFTAGGQIVATSAATTFTGGTCASITVGARIVAKGSLLSDMTFAATSVQIK